MKILGIETKNGVYNAINDNPNLSKNENINSSPKSIRLNDVSYINQCKISYAPIITKPKSEEVDIANLIGKLTPPFKSVNEINNQTKNDSIYILLLVNKLTANSSISDIINRGNAINAELMSMSHITPDKTSGGNVISNILNHLKEIVPIFDDIIHLLSFGMGAPGSIMLLANVIDKIQQLVTGVSLEDQLEDNVIKPLLSYLGKEISEALVSLGVNQSTAQVISGGLAKTICAAIAISTLKFSDELIDKEVYEKAYELIKQNFMPDIDVLGLICNDVIKQVNTLLPPNISNLLQPFEQDLEKAISQFDGNVIDMVFNFASQQDMDTNSIEKLLTTIKNSLNSQLGNLLHQLFTTAKGGFIQLERKYITELLSNLGEEISNTLKNVLPKALWLQLQPFEKSFAEFSANFVDEISDLSGQLINIISGSVRAGHLDINALSTALTELEANMQSSLERLMNAVVTTTRREVLAPEQKNIEELLSWAGNKIIAVLQKELPETLQPLLSKMEDNFSAFSSDFVDEISGFSGQLINIIGDSVRAGYLDINALSTALTELEANMQSSLERLMNVVVTTTRREVLASEQKTY
ncbi:hypothetical protein [Yokenella regensburgei]|uniref:hypothetical protein n=1 Tax=Yokenella regensburgei TaxID=158877 RepID=UPI001375BAB6|nr:hypothetical protein [Yokenella regensburgei]KAF1366410.1 hypothetical protein FHR25_005120 [Yokenella regensburgei]